MRRIRNGMPPIVERLCATCLQAGTNGEDLDDWEERHSGRRPPTPGPVAPRT